MTSDESCALPRWLWRSTLWLMALVLIAALVLVTALALGWNSSRPTRAPDWQALGLPLDLEAAPDETVTSLLGRSSGDFTLEVKAAPLTGSDLNGYGLIYRAQDLTRYYVFAIGGDGYYAVLQVDGEEETPLVEWQQFPHVRRGRQANRLRVACVDITCRFYINDEYAATAEDGTWVDGDVGLWVRGFEENVLVQFVDARMWRE